jgi:hypothetical protein
MPNPPAGEAQLRALAAQYESVDSVIRGLIREAGLGGPRHAMLIEALSLLIAARRTDVSAAVLAAYLHQHPRGHESAVSDVAASLATRLYRGAQVTADSTKAAFKAVTAENIEEMAAAAVVAHVDRRGTSWSLGRWATMNTQTIGRTASSRGVADEVGEGGKIAIQIGECQLCHELFNEDSVVGDPMPPGHPGCTCTASPA